MAAAPKPAPQAPRGAQAAKAPPRKPALRPDLSTLAGIGVALTGIIGGLLLEKGNIQDVAQGTAAMIVLGGTLGAVLVTTPLPVFLRRARRPQRSRDGSRPARHGWRRTRLRG